MCSKDETSFFEYDEEYANWPISIENLSVVRAPLLKVYYWESLDIDGLNKKLNSSDKHLEHDLYIPTAQINSYLLKIVFWIRDKSRKGTTLFLKRIKNCDCVAHMTRIGFNQYKKLYHCPHRHLVNTLMEEVHFKPDELVALSFDLYFYLLGQHKLTYELRCNQDFVMHLNFHLDIVCFEPQKCLITKELIPVEMSESRRFIQALWVRNITMKDLKFNFSTQSRSMRIVNSNLTVPRQSIWPLMVEYRPTEDYDELQLTQTFDKVKTVHQICGSGYIGDIKFAYSMPESDYSCHSHRYVIYPGRVEFDVGQDEERSLMANIHNYSQHCLDFKWQNYVINNMFSITYEPGTFRLKPHHSKLCIIHLRSFDRAMHFMRVPLVLEVHRLFDRSTKIAKDLLSEIESIDDPKWKEESYMEHVLLQVDLKINFKERIPIDLKYDRIIPPLTSWICELPTGTNQTLTIFEKLFWEYLSQSDFMRKKHSEICEKRSYSEIFDLNINIPSGKRPTDLSKNHVLGIVSMIIGEGIREISKNWIFVPKEHYERPL